MSRVVDPAPAGNGATTGASGGGSGMGAEYTIIGAADGFQGTGGEGVAPTGKGKSCGHTGATKPPKGGPGKP